MLVHTKVNDSRGLYEAKFYQGTNTLELLFRPEDRLKEKVVEALSTMDTSNIGGFNYEVKGTVTGVKATLWISPLVLPPLFNGLADKEIIGRPILSELEEFAEQTLEGHASHFATGDAPQEGIITLPIRDSMSRLKNIKLDFTENKICLTFKRYSDRDEAMTALQEDYKDANRFGLLGFTAKPYGCDLSIDCADVGQIFPILYFLQDEKLLHKSSIGKGVVCLHAKNHLKLDEMLGKKRQAMGLEESSTQSTLTLDSGSPLKKLCYNPPLNRLEIVIRHDEAGDAFFKEMQKKIKRSDYSGILIKPALSSRENNAIILAHNDPKRHKDCKSPEETLRLFTDMDGSQPSLGLLTRRQYEFARLNLDFGTPLKPDRISPRTGGSSYLAR